MRTTPIRKATCPECGHNLSAIGELFCKDCPACGDYQAYMEGLLEERDILRAEGKLP